MATLKGCRMREYQYQLRNGYHWREEKEDVLEIVAGRSASRHENKKFRNRSV